MPGLQTRRNMRYGDILGIIYEVEGGDEDGKDENVSEKEQDASVMDYFLNVIQFSHIVGQVNKELYHPTQQTAHLLHNIIDERSLIHDFPWWQMISCLICASSILLVAGAFFEEDGNSLDLLSQDFDQDAETCLKVFEALSVNSEAARKATDMLKGLKGQRVRSNYAYRQRMHIQSSTENQVANMPLAPSYMSPTDSTLVGQLDPNNTDNLNWWYELPSEMSNTMAWSAQFLHPAYNAVDDNPEFFNVDDSEGV